MNFLKSLLLLICVTSMLTLAQENPNTEKGIKPFGSYITDQIDTINIVNGGLTLHIPVATVPQRGLPPLEYYLGYTDKKFSVAQDCDPYGGCTLPYWTVYSGGMEDDPQYYSRPDLGPRIVETHSLDNEFYVVYDIFVADNYPDMILWGYRLFTADGAAHQVGGDGGRTLDATGYSTTDHGIDKLGLRYGLGLGTVYLQDPNGNEITVNDQATLTDTLNRMLPRTRPLGRIASPIGTPTSDSSQCTGPLPISDIRLVSFPGYNGATAVFKLCYAIIQEKTNFQTTTTGGSGGGNIILEFQSPATVLQSFVLPDGHAWTFEYNDRDSGDGGDINYGNLTKVSLPTGGTINYQWHTVSICGLGDTLTPVTRALFTRVVDAADGTGPHTWTYLNPGATNNPQNQLPNWSLAVTEVGPDGNHTVHTFNGLSNTCSMYETQTDYYQGNSSSGQRLKTVRMTYSSFSNPYETTLESAVNVLKTNVTTVLENSQTGLETFDYDQGQTFTFTTNDGYYQSTYSANYGNISNHKIYDYGSGSPGPLLREERTAYVALSNSNYLSANLLTLVSDESIYDGGGSLVSQTVYGYDDPARLFSPNPPITTQHTDAPGPVRGNLTSVTRWLDTGASPVSYTNWYDTGKVYQAIDPGSHYTTFSYDPAFAGAYLTSTTNALSQSISGWYDYNTGLLTSFTDLNNKSFSYNYDSMNRMVSANFPDGGATTFSYPNLNQVETRRKKDDSGAYWTDRWTEYDGLGRFSREALWNAQGSNYWDESVVCYDAVGQVGYRSYPFQDNGWGAPKNCNAPGDHFYYDALGRGLQVLHSPDNSTIDTSYWGRARRIMEEWNGNSRPQRIIQVDALGRTSSACEVSSAQQLGSGGTPVGCGQDIGDTGFLTSYTFDARGDLRLVHQDGLPDRVFNYDSLSRLTYSYNPESNWVNYYYNIDSLLTQRTRPAPNNTAGNVDTYYGYETLHRLTSRTYSDSTRPAYFNYDETTRWGSQVINGTGRQTSSWTNFADGTGNGDYIWEFDPMGRIKTNGHCTPRTCGWSGYNLNYNYDLLGNVVLQTNGVGVTFNHNYSAAGRLVSTTSSLVDAEHPGTLLNNIHYGPSGIDGLTLNNDRLSESRGYSPRGLLQSVTVNGVYSFSLSFAPNGNITSSNDSVNNSWTYTYDDFNRLSTAVANDGRGCSEVYDRFGNRAQQNPYSGSCPNPNFSFSNNRIDQYTYDAVGNVLYDTSHWYTYDGENRLIAIDNGNTARYDYDAQGQRIRNSSSEFMYDLAGHAVTMLDRNTGGWMRGEIYAAGRHLATYVNSTTYFTHADWLGTERKRTMVNTNEYSHWISFPFGEGSSTSDPSPLHFTGKERDAETGLDNFSVRYYGSGMGGRFMSTDPFNLLALKPNRFQAWIANPQRWNKYVYALNNPVNMIDPDGLNACGTKKDSDCIVRVFITDRTKDKNGNYNDQFKDVKNQASYNATAMVLVTNKQTGTTTNAGTFLARTEPSDTGRFPTTAAGGYQATLTTHSGHQALRLQPTDNIPIVNDVNPAHPDRDYAQGILVHIAGLENYTGMTRAGGGVSEGCLLVCRSQYSDFLDAVGATATPPQRRFDVILATSPNMMPGVVREDDIQ